MENCEQFQSSGNENMSGLKRKRSLSQEEPSPKKKASVPVPDKHLQCKGEEIETCRYCGVQVDMSCRDELYIGAICLHCRVASEPQPLMTVVCGGGDSVEFDLDDEANSDIIEWDESDTESAFDDSGEDADIDTASDSEYSDSDLDDDDVIQFVQALVAHGLMPNLLLGEHKPRRPIGRI